MGKADITDADCNLATADLFHAEIARLHAVNDRLRAEIERLRSQAFNPLTLTDAEREAVEAFAFDRPMDRTKAQRNAATLRGLLERTK